jgi:hypothetical protein
VRLGVDGAMAGRWRTFVLDGYLPVQLSPHQLVAGRTGRGQNPPPQFGHTLPSTPSTHATQNVHSKVQMRASSASGGKGLLQFSQVGRSSSMRAVYATQRWCETSVCVVPANDG